MVRKEKHMSLFDDINTKINHTPDYVVPMTNNLTNSIFLDPNLTDFDIFNNVAEFIAVEFTKVMFVIEDETPNKAKLEYLLNLQPNKNQTANQLLYEFAYSILKHGYVYFKVDVPKDAKQPRAIYVSRTAQTGYTRFDYKHLKLALPTRLTDEYSSLIHNLSTRHTTSVIEIKSMLKGLKGEQDPNSPAAQQAMDNRLQTADNQIQKHGKFFTGTNESTQDHNNVTEPDGSALTDLKTLIYEHLHLSPKMLSGEYTEEDYRAFYAKHLQPLIGALEELLNCQLFDYVTYSAGAHISIILDLMQFATLESFTQMAKEGIYNGYLQTDDVRGKLGLKPYPDGLGQIIWSNKNAVALNDDEINKKLETGANTNEDSQVSDQS